MRSPDSAPRAACGGSCSRPSSLAQSRCRVNAIGCCKTQAIFSFAARASGRQQRSGGAGRGTAIGCAGDRAGRPDEGRRPAIPARWQEKNPDGHRYQPSMEHAGVHRRTRFEDRRMGGSDLDPMRIAPSGELAAAGPYDRVTGAVGDASSSCGLEQWRGSLRPRQGRGALSGPAAGHAAGPPEEDFP